MTGIFFARYREDIQILDRRVIITCSGGFLPAIAIYSKSNGIIIRVEPAMLCKATTSFSPDNFL
jgi:hypothetical protein